MEGRCGVECSTKKMMDHRRRIIVCVILCVARWRGLACHSGKYGTIAGAASPAPPGRRHLVGTRVGGSVGSTEGRGEDAPRWPGEAVTRTPVCRASSARAGHRADDPERRGPREARIIPSTTNRAPWGGLQRELSSSAGVRSRGSIHAKKPTTSRLGMDRGRDSIGKRSARF